MNTHPTAIVRRALRDAGLPDELGRVRDYDNGPGHGIGVRTTGTRGERVTILRFHQARTWPLLHVITCLTDRYGLVASSELTCDGPGGPIRTVELHWPRTATRPAP